MIRRTVISLARGKCRGHNPIMYEIENFINKYPFRTYCCALVWSDLLFGSKSIPVVWLSYVMITFPNVTLPSLREYKIVLAILTIYCALFAILCSPHVLKE